MFFVVDSRIHLTMIKFRETKALLPLIFFVGRGLNFGPCIYYALSLLTELSLQEPLLSLVKKCT